MIFNKTYTLSNGVKIPALGLGTWLLDDAIASLAVRRAVELGYRHIDTAQAYMNEIGVGEGIRTCGIPREEIFVTSKIGAEHKSYSSAAVSIDETLGRLKLEYIDMMIIHSPQPWEEWRGKNRYFKENVQVWKALEDAYKAGKVRAIGISNFLFDDIENLLTQCEIMPMVNQILVHVGNTPEALVDFCKSNGMLVEAYSPIGHGAVLKNNVLANMSGKYGVSIAQLCIRYVLQLGIVALPKTSNPVHMKSNGEIEFEISEDDMKVLKALSITDYGTSAHFPVFSGK